MTTPAQRMLCRGAEVRLRIHGTAWRLGGRSFVATASEVQYETTTELEAAALPTDIRIEFLRTSCPQLHQNDTIIDADGNPWRVMDAPYSNPGDTLARATCRKLSQ